MKLLSIWFGLFISCDAVFEKPVLESKVEVTINFCGEEFGSPEVEETVFEVVGETQGWDSVASIRRKRNCSRPDAITLQVYCPDEESLSETSLLNTVSTPDLKTALVAAIMVCPTVRSFASFGPFDRSKLTILQSAISDEGDSILLFVGDFGQDSLFWEIWLDSLRLRHLNVLRSSFGDSGSNQIFLISKFNRSTYFNGDRPEFEIYVRQLFANYSSRLDEYDEDEVDDSVADDEGTTSQPLLTKIFEYHHKRVVRLREENSLRKYSAGILALLSLFILLIIYMVLSLVKHLSSSR
ncbi:uncharacterized protein LOC100907751 [Galendromus occidentalis]|uniref:Uncharacterized protein LOC100907751 n=1 Tax=Galendromus occidentalis TaxID=34638 RepID=A0AAJ6QV37_9ACAR|nr:uncharacterized protein LOC100907751 [Galendromus occidentalis]